MNRCCTLAKIFRKNAKEASRYFEIFANNGNQEAAFVYTAMLSNGIGITADKK